MAANRMKPHIVKEIREPIDGTDELGPVFQEIQPTVLNTIDAEPGWMKRVQLGFKKVYQEPGGTAYNDLQVSPTLLQEKPVQRRRFMTDRNELSLGRSHHPL